MNFSSTEKKVPVLSYKMIGKDEIKELAKEFKELATKMQSDSQNKNKVISHFSQIINSTKKQYQNAIKNYMNLRMKINS